jgi:hypothetical protein
MSTKEPQVVTLRPDVDQLASRMVTMLDFGVRQEEIVQPKDAKPIEYMPSRRYIPRRVVLYIGRESIDIIGFAVCPVGEDERSKSASHARLQRSRQPTCDVYEATFDDPRPFPCLIYVTLLNHTHKPARVTAALWLEHEDEEES